MRGNCSIAMHLSQLLAGLIVLIAIMGLGLASDVDDKTVYPWQKQLSTHKMPYKVSGDI
ncbi:uncharacterized protein LOC110183116 [Drosophila serrata]|uniref:uncharacterized protein LOC110183116 n=1 Tax=Drosophila serrata TaxID=7274 RepID=UPI000A1D02E9|nr:uncharacterized protein LOC110183116 [Drosophila serrata]